MMRKTTFLILLTFLLALQGASATAASKATHSVQSIGVVIIGDKEFQQERFYSQISDILNSRSNKVTIGTKTQASFAQFCQASNIAEKALPKVNDMVEFAKQENFDKLVGIVIREPMKNNFKRKVSNHEGLVDRTICALQLDFYIFDKERSLKVFSVAKDKLASNETDATVGAFDKCVDKVRKDINKVL